MSTFYGTAVCSDAASSASQTVSFFDDRLPPTPAFTSLRGRRVQSLPPISINPFLLTQIPTQLLASIPERAPQSIQETPPGVFPRTVTSPVFSPDSVLERMPEIKDFFKKLGETDDLLPPPSMRSPRHATLQDPLMLSPIPTSPSLEFRSQRFIQGTQIDITDVVRVHSDGSMIPLVEAHPLELTYDGHRRKSPEEIAIDVQRLHMRAVNTHMLVKEHGVENIVEVFEVECRESDGSWQTHFEMMPYKPDLISLLIEATRVSEASGVPYDRLPFLRIACDVARALMGIHGAGYIHRDVKPDNILTNGGQGLLTDFEFLVAISEREIMLPKGTPGYLPPEVFTHRKGLLPYPSYDNWSFGSTLCSILLADAPFKEIQEALVVQTTAAPPSPETFGQLTAKIEGVRCQLICSQDEIATLTARLLSIEPGRRPTAATAYAVLRKYISEHS